MENEILKGVIADREKDIESMASTINTLRGALLEILDILSTHESSPETERMVELVAEKALGL